MYKSSLPIKHIINAIPIKIPKNTVGTKPTIGIREYTKKVYHSPYFVSVYPSKNITVEVCFKHNSSGERCLFGVSSGAENWQNDGKVFAVYISNHYLDAYVGKKYEQVAPCTQNEWHTVSLKWDSVVVDGVNYGNVWGNTDYSGYTENIHIGSRNTSTHVWEGDASEFTYKYIKIYDNDTLIKDIIPMVQRDGGFPCIYNKVNGEFTFSKGREPIINW